MQFELVKYHDRIGFAARLFKLSPVPDRVYVADHIVMREQSINDPAPLAFDMAEEELQGIMDSLWRAGFRPSDKFMLSYLADTLKALSLPRAE